MKDISIEGMEKHQKLEMSIPEHGLRSDKRKHYLTRDNYSRMSDRIAKERYDDLGGPID